MTTDYYSILGIDRDATPDQVKEGFRRAAAKAHPDRDGGSHESMALVNRAHEILSDPERRKAFDERGEDSAPGSLDGDARDMLMQVLSEALQGDGNLVVTARAKLQGMREAMRQNAITGARAAAKLTARRDRVTSKGETNLVHALIDQQVDAINRQLAILEQGQLVATLASQLLEQHESSEPVFSQLVQPVGGGWRTF